MPIYGWSPRNDFLSFYSFHVFHRHRNTDSSSGIRGSGSTVHCLRPALTNEQSREPEFSGLQGLGVMREYADTPCCWSKAAPDSCVVWSAAACRRPGLCDVRHFSRLLWYFVFDHPPSGVVYNFGRVCLSVCLSDVFESLDAGSSHLHIRYFSREYGVKFVYEGHWVKVKVTGAKTVENHYFRNVKRRSAVTPVSYIKHRDMKFACSVDFSAMMDQMVWPPSLSRDRN